MNLLTEKISKIYFKYLAAAFGSTLIISIYSLVDTIVIGRFEGPNGTAAVASFMPMWSFMIALGLLFGIGGSVVMAQKRGADDFEEGNRYFSVAVILGLFTSALIFLAYNFIPDRILMLSGARDEVLELALKYAHWVAFAAPLFLMGQLLIPFIRNDGSPFLTTVAVIAGGVFNVFGDLYLVFGLNMGIAGAGLATALGEVLCFAVLLGYMFSKKCHMSVDFKVLRNGFSEKSKRIILVGGATFIVDIAIGILAILINNQLIKYSGESALAVYGIISSLVTVVQSFGYAVGESGQAVMSINYGAGNKERVVEARKIMLVTAVVLCIICCVLGMLVPKQLIYLYMTPNAEVLSIGVKAIRIYFIALIFLVFNVASTYYFQAVSKLSDSFVVSMARGLVLSGLLVVILPMLFGINGVWIAIPLTEGMVSIYVCLRIVSDKEI
ncbi:MATE family efflux transporter [Pseudobutyrivibrio sp.]